MKIDTFTWKDVISNNPSINILLNHENLFIFYFMKIKIQIFIVIVFRKDLWSET